MSSSDVKNETEVALSSGEEVVSQLAEEKRNNDWNEVGDKQKEDEIEGEEEVGGQEEEEEEENDLTPTPSSVSRPKLPPRDTDDEDRFTPDNYPSLSPPEIIRNAAKDAIKFNDYISYATVLEQLTEDPSKYDDDQRQEILEALLEVLESDDELVREIGWDLPIPLLQYVESEYKFEEGLSTSIHIKLVMRIFTVLCERGNAKELFLKGVEALSSLKVAPEVGDDKEADQDTNTEIKERYGDMKFYLAFELMFFSLRRIDVQYPSRFLATAITVLLSFLASNLEHLKILSLGVILRRYFTFARDYQTGIDVESELPVDDKEYSESEIEVQQKLLQSFITWVTDFTFQRFSVQWAQRLYYELKTGVTADNKKSPVYELHLYTERVTECIERLAQLSYSFDMDVIKLLKTIINKEDKEDEPEDEENSKSKTSTFSDLSDEGIFLLATQVRFDYRVHSDEDITFSDLVKLSLRFYRKASGDGGSNAPLGIQDASLFWGLWLTRNITPEEVRKVSPGDFAVYLQSLMVLSATSTDKESRFIAYSLTAKLLSLHTANVSFEFIVDTLTYCPFENVKDATVRILKTLSLPRGPGSTGPIPSPALRRASTVVDTLAEGVSSLSIAAPSSVSPAPDGTLPPIIPLTAEKLSTIEKLVDQTLEEVLESGGIFSESLPVLLSWINFITVIETDKKFLEKFTNEASKLLVSKSDDERSKEALRQRQGFLTLSIESLRKRWLD